MQLAKLMQSVVAAEVVDSVVDSGGEVVVTGAAVALPEVAVKISQVSLTPNRDQDSTRVLNIQTYPRVIGRGARCTSATGARLIFVRSPSHVLGRMSLLQRIQIIRIETGTSLAILLTKSISDNYILHCTTNISSKYIVS